MVTKASASDDKSIAIKEKEKKELRFIEKGVGQPIALIHGSLSDFREWEFQIDKFAQNYHVISYSRRYAYPNKWVGNGDDYDNTIPNNVADLLELIIKRLNLGPAHIIGHSYGAFTAADIGYNQSNNYLYIKEPFTNDNTALAKTC